MRLLKDLFHLFYPKLCVVCEDNLVENETTICTLCRHDLPLTNFTDYKENKVTQTFYGRILIEKAFSLLFYRKKGSTQKLIHDLKYKGNEEIGVFFGDWLGEILKENNEFATIDYIIPVPLHPKKLRERGYNQVTRFGKTLSKHLEIEYLENYLIRISSTKTQTFKARFERFNNIETKFLLTNPSFFDHKNILLIDDVITTGATLEACAKEFLKSKNCTINILTMGYTE
ncbi:ComF family protein [Polaribacter glomeratus]|uniref:Amidophosphoribosyltransferase n=1 Tax=Polaribacter glomeratus TaxID=102 RepID=A0A2S7WFJ1_9FLAO|nr:ComF family protein [Polaribacter glomeratus]PQJ76367.1 amidophosphoribosyltransferase [Polaribacter glomeratus]TXD65502.1 ComF family protein [Polaribacter glomeratus]